MAIPWPPPIHMVTRPVFSPRSRSSYRTLMVRIAPVSYTHLEELHILTDFKIDFIGMSDERRTILRDMKEETLRLAQSRG